MKKKNLAAPLMVFAASLNNCNHEAKETRSPHGTAQRQDSLISEQAKQCIGELANFSSGDFAYAAVALHLKASECKANVKQVEEWLKVQEQYKWRFE